MHRYSPVRTHRSKGFKIKHVLRICFLIVVCCWLIFQIKRSHYKRKDLGPVDTEILSSTKSIHEVIKLGRKDIQPKETETHEEEEEEEDEEHGIEEEEKIEDEKDDEVDENEQYKFDDDDDDDDTVNESEEKDGQGQSQSQTANEAREEHYKADDASSAVTHEHEAQALDNSGGFLETTAKIQETGSGSTNKANNSGSTRVMEELETSLNSTNMSTVVESQTILTTKENDSNSSQTEDETEDSDEFHQDAIDSTDFIRLEDLEALDNSEDTVAE